MAKKEASFYFESYYPLFLKGTGKTLGNLIRLYVKKLVLLEFIIGNMRFSLAFYQPRSG